MYAIANVIYGIVVDEDLDDQPELDTYFKTKVKGFHQFYSGSADYPPRSFGVRIQSFNSFDPVDLSKVMMKLTDEVKKEYDEMFLDLDLQLQQDLKNIGEPYFHILWSTS